MQACIRINIYPMILILLFYQKWGMIIPYKYWFLLSRKHLLGPWSVFCNKANLSELFSTSVWVLWLHFSKAVVKGFSSSYVSLKRSSITSLQTLDMYSLLLKSPKYNRLLRKKLLFMVIYHIHFKFDSSVQKCLVFCQCSIRNDSLILPILPFGLIVFDFYNFFLEHKKFFEHMWYI